MALTAWVRLTPGTIHRAPHLAASLERGGIGGVHATGRDDAEDLDDLDDAILWAAERCPRIVVDAGERLSAGVEAVAPYERFAGDAAARARSAVRAAHERYADERAADADDDVHHWYFAAYDPDLAADAVARDVAQEVAAHGDVVAVHVREDADGTPVWIVELEAHTAADAATRGHEILLAAFWPASRRDDDAHHEICHGAQDVGLVDYLDETLLQLD